ncbi:MAG: hypothetical protein R3B51_02485 [Thermodesulfobacteriota bacterium]
MLEALGLGLVVGPNDIAIRGNFATVKYEGDTPIVTDRRAGRIPTQGEYQDRPQDNGEDQGDRRGQVNVTSGMEHRVAVILTFPGPVPKGGDDITTPIRSSKGRAQ